MYKNICLNCVSREITENELYCNDCKLEFKKILGKMNKGVRPKNEN